jgi:acetyl/propionyl-CoA carboxylase alpha subunit
VADAVSEGLVVTRLGPGVYRVDHDRRTDVVYVAGPPGDRWAFWNGLVFRSDQIALPESPRAAPSLAPQVLAAPMPASVLRVLVEPGQRVRKGDPVVVLEAMKMELPLLAPADGSVAAVRCREGDLVAPGAQLIELREGPPAAS